MYSLLHILATCCGRLQEDGQIWGPKHVGGYADYNKFTYLYMHLLGMSHKRLYVFTARHFSELTHMHGCEHRTFVGNLKCTQICKIFKSL
jgi:hypothetical protein